MQVLLVDDDESARAYFESILSREMPIVATHAATADEALRYLGVIDPIERRDFDVALVDLNLPDLSGISLCRRVRSVARLRALPIIFVTAHSQRSLVREALAAGANEYVLKPVRGPELLARVAAVMRRDRRPVELPPVDVTAPLWIAGSTPEPATPTPIDDVPEGTGPVPRWRGTADVVTVEAWLMPRLSSFLANRRADLRVVERAVMRGTFEEIGRIGHNLRGTAASYGFTHLGELGSRLEEAAAQKDGAAILVVVADIAAHLERVRIVPGPRGA